IKDQEVAGSRKSFWNEMGVMLTDDLADRTQLRRGAEIGAHLPNDRTFARNDSDERRFPAADDHVLRRKALVAFVVPVFLTHVSCGVDVHPIEGAACRVGAWRGRYGIASVLVEMEFIDVVASHPLPDDLSVPGDFDEAIVFECFPGSDLWLNMVGMGEQ